MSGFLELFIYMTNVYMRHLFQLYALLVREGWGDDLLDTAKVLSNKEYSRSVLAVMPHVAVLICTENFTIFMKAVLVYVCHWLVY